MAQEKQLDGSPEEKPEELDDEEEQGQPTGLDEDPALRGSIRNACGIRHRLQ